MYEARHLNCFLNSISRDFVYVRLSLLAFRNHLAQTEVGQLIQVVCQAASLVSLNNFPILRLKSFKSSSVN